MKTNIVKTIKRNAPTILTCVAAGGVVLTAVSAVKATPKAMELVGMAEDDKGERLTKVETVVVAAPAYVPSVLIGVSTIACIFGANALNKKQQVALMSAYALLDTSFKDYRNKIIEMYGEETDKTVRTEIMKDNFDYKPDADDKITFYDESAGRYFESTLLEVKDAKYELNRIFVSRGHVTLNDWYDILGLDRTRVGDVLGWSTYRGYDEYGYSMVDIDEHKAVLDDGFECYILSFAHPPTCDYLEY